MRIRVFILLFLLLLSSLQKNGEYMYFQWALGLCACSVATAIYLRKRLGFIFAIFAAYVGIYSSYLFMNQQGRYLNFQQDFKDSISVHTGFTLLLCVVVLFTILEMPKNYRKAMRLAIPLYGVCDALWVIRSFFIDFKLHGGFGYTGFLNYSGMNGVLMALCAAFLIPTKEDEKAARYCKGFGLILITIGVVLSRNAIPFGVLGLVVMGRMLKVWPFILALGMGGLTVGSKMVNSSSRFEAYKIFTKFILSEHRVWFGGGLGSLPVYGPTAQLRANFMLTMVDNRLKGYLWPWLHSDFIQSFFELGALGFTLVILIYLLALWKSYPDRELFSFGLGLGGAALLNYPCRYFVTALFLTYFVVEALEKKFPRHTGLRGGVPMFFGKVLPFL